MGVGLAMFLIALIWIAIQYPKVVRNVIVTILAVAGLLFLIGKWHNQPIAEEKYFGVNGGDSETSVRYKKGLPESSSNKFWKYGNYTVAFYDNHQVAYVICSGISSLYCDSASGINFGEHEEAVIDRLGKPPSTLQTSPDTRLLIFPGYHLGVGLRNDTVDELSVWFSDRQPGGLAK